MALPDTVDNAVNKKTLVARFNSFQTVMRNIPHAFALVWQTSPLLTTVLAFLVAFSAIIPAAQAWVAKLIIDSIVGFHGANDPIDTALSRVMVFITIEIVIFGASLIFSEGSSLVQHILSTRLAHHVNTILIRKAIDLDLQHFENPTFYDQLKNIRSDAGAQSFQVVRTTFEMVQSLLMLSTFIILLFRFSPITTLLLATSTLPSLMAKINGSNEYYGFRMAQTSESRRMIYLEHLLTTDVNAKEIKIFGLGSPFLKRYIEIFIAFEHEDTRIARKRAINNIFWEAVSGFGYYFAYLWVVWRALAGTITIGDVMLYLAIFRQTQSVFQSIFFNIGQVYESGLFLDALFDFLSKKPLTLSTQNVILLPKRIQKGITFENVSFRYPNREEDALINLNFHIGPGEKIALVGSNGAGKTTLVKLLTRLYDPTSGRILLDGEDLRSYDVEDLRKRVGVIFQDFVQYYATLRENVAFGQIDLLEQEDVILNAARRGGADKIAAELPQQFDTMLGHWFERGVQLSGGQWQKIALSRAFMRDGEILVLDEPTAALDAEQEYEIFQRFRELTSGKIAILISHRFSTVRMADRIIVLDSGQLTEIGTHSELINAGGIYYRLFSLQAEGYR